MGPVAGLQVLVRTVLVEQGQLGAGVGSLAADNDTSDVRVAREVDQAGRFGDLGAGAQGAVLFQGGVPDAVGHGPGSRCGPGR